jgi:hypothetical protein
VTAKHVVCLKAGIVERGRREADARVAAERGSCLQHLENETGRENMLDSARKYRL